MAFTVLQQHTKIGCDIPRFTYDNMIVDVSSILFHIVAILLAFMSFRLSRDRAIEIRLVALPRRLRRSLASAKLPRIFVPFARSIHATSMAFSFLARDLILRLKHICEFVAH